MYQQISSNRRKSWLLIALFTGVLSAAGYAYGMLTGQGFDPLVLALTVSLVMTLVSWHAGDRIVLLTSGAREVTERAQNPYLWNMVENLAITAGISRPRLYLIEDASPNAFATGRDPAHASIAVTTGLIHVLENEELEGVLAHELSHIKNYDIRFMMLVAVLVGSLTLLGDFFLRGSLFGHRRSESREGAGGALALVGIVFLVLSPLVGELIKLAISRRREFLADADGALLTRFPEGLASALEKIQAAGQPLTRASQATAHLWISSPFGSRSRKGFARLFSTHPPIEERVKQLRSM